MEAALRGADVKELPAEWRTWRLLQVGVSLTEQAEAPAAQLDWLLAIDNTVTKYRNEANE